MTESQICSFVEKYNTEVEEDWKPMSYDDNITKIELLDEIMTIQDANVPQWIEAYSIASDGTLYFARADKREYSGILDAYYAASNRSKHLANMRGGAAS